eukprot:967153-Pyramimonas_sp.AAC.1
MRCRLSKGLPRHASASPANHRHKQRTLRASTWMVRASGLMLRASVRVQRDGGDVSSMGVEGTVAGASGIDVVHAQ